MLRVLNFLLFHCTISKVQLGKDRNVEKIHDIKYSLTFHLSTFIFEEDTVYFRLYDTVHVS